MTLTFNSHTSETEAGGSFCTQNQSGLESLSQTCLCLSKNGICIFCLCAIISEEIHTSRGQGDLVSCSVTCYPIFLRQGLPLDVGLGWQSPVIFLSQPPTFRKHMATLHFYMGAEDSSSCLHVCVASGLTHWFILQPLNLKSLLEVQKLSYFQGSRKSSCGKISSCLLQKNSQIHIRRDLCDVLFQIWIKRDLWDVFYHLLWIAC